jgi:hypothetical protein
MRRLSIVIVLAAAFAASAAASGPPGVWSTRDMTTAIRGLGYPTSHPIKLSCKGLGAATNGRYASFLCKATYRHSIRRRFVAAGHGVGGWVCAEKPGAGYCVLLPHGFVVMAHTNAANALEARAKLAASGYVENRYGIADASPSGPCVQRAPDGTKWTCPYMSNRGKVMEVTISLKAARGGYITTGTAAPGT